MKAITALEILNQKGIGHAIFELTHGTYGLDGRDIGLEAISAFAQRVPASDHAILAVKYADEAVAYAKTDTVLNSSVSMYNAVSDAALSSCRNAALASKDPEAEREWQKAWLRERLEKGEEQ